MAVLGINIKNNNNNNCMRKSRTILPNGSPTPSKAKKPNNILGPTMATSRIGNSD